MDRNPDQMDRDRLKQIEQSDLGESRVNQDFVDWLKTKGPNWLLVILAALCVYMVIVRWKDARFQKNVEAWEALATADLPRSKEDVADKYDNVRGVQELAWLVAARQYMESVRANATVASIVDVSTAQAQGQQPLPELESLSPEQREQNLAESERLFNRILESVGQTAELEPGRLLLKIAATEGLAAVAEAKGDAATAKSLYEQAASDAGDTWPHLAEQASARAASVDASVTVASLPTEAQLGRRALLTQFQSSNTPQPMLPSLQRLIQSPEPMDEATPAPTEG